MRARHIVFALLFIAACRKDGGTKEPDPAQPTGADPVADTTVPQADDGAEPSDSAEPPADGGEAAPGADECVSKCTASRQMKAISAEAIEKECQADCASGSFK